MWLAIGASQWLTFLALQSIGALADLIDDHVSFGQNGDLSPNLRGIPNWHIQGEPTPPQLLKDRVILTPPYPGNKRAAIWAERKLQHQDWTADVEFRATGPERGGGNLQIWYAQGGESQIKTSSIYTVNKFDGLVLVVDTYGGRGGSIRGFLNDGNVDYKNHHSVDSLPFGHCDYPYRNLGRLTKLQLKQAGNGFEVNVDGRLCFSTDKVKLPSDYYFGISAASAEQPDSIEVFKFVVSSSSVPIPPPSNDLPRDGSKSQYPSSNDQSQKLSDLQARLQSMSQQLENLQRSMQDSASSAQSRHQELTRKDNKDLLAGLDKRLQSVESAVQSIQKDVTGMDFRELKVFLERRLSESHTNLMEKLPHSMNQIVTGSAPRMWFFIGMIALLQALLAICYVVYKRKRANAPKKYL